MRPAFSSTKQAAAFAGLLLALLLSPVLVGKNLLPPREQAYAVPGWSNGPYPWIRNQIFEETNDIDIAIIGSSHIWNAINTPYVPIRFRFPLSAFRFGYFGNVRQSNAQALRCRCRI